MISSLAQNTNKHASLQPTKQIKRNKTQQGNNKRRAKRACVHCKKAKTSCSNTRPCERCVRLNLADTCMDPPHSDITNEDRHLWETTLKVLTENKSTKQYSQEQQKLMEMLQTYAQRVSQPISVQDSPSHLPALDSHPAMGKMDFLLKQNDFLSKQVEFLTRQMEISQSQSQSLMKGETLYQFSLLSTMGSLAYSRWSFPEYVLLDYNHGFLELSGHRNPEIGRFNCTNLFMDRHLFACGFLVMLLRDGIVKSVEVNQLWSVRGQEVPVKAIMVLNFDSAGAPVETVMYCKRSQFPFPSDSLFKPLEFEMSKKSKSKGFTADMLRRLFNRSCVQPSVDTQFHQQFGAPGSITVQALLKLGENPQGLGETADVSVLESPPLSQPPVEKPRCPLRTESSPPPPISPLSNQNDWNVNPLTSHVNRSPPPHMSMSPPPYVSMSPPPQMGVSPSHHMDSLLFTGGNGNPLNPHPSSTMMMGHVSPPEDVFMNQAEELVAPRWTMDHQSPFEISLLADDDLLVGESPAPLVGPLSYLSHPLESSSSSPYGEGPSPMNDDPLASSNPLSNVPNPNDPALDEFFMSNSIGINTNDDIFDQFFDDPVNSSDSMFRVSGNSSIKWNRTAPEDQQHPISLNHFL